MGRKMVVVLLVIVEELVAKLPVQYVSACPYDAPQTLSSGYAGSASECRPTIFQALSRNFLGVAK